MTRRLHFWVRTSAGLAMEMLVMVPGVAGPGESELSFDNHRDTLAPPMPSLKFVFGTSDTT